MKGFADLSHLSENQRIDAIGKFVMRQPANSTIPPQIIGIALETEEKAKRYEKKLLKKFPTIRILDIVPGIVPGTVLLKISGPAL